MKRKRFTSLKTAESFAKSVKGTVIDVTEDSKCDCNYVVKYPSIKEGD